MTACHWLQATAALPFLVASCALGAVAVAERTGRTFLTAPAPANLAEAAAAGRSDDVLRRVWAGEDRFRLYPLSRWVIGDEVRTATPAEAAVWSRQLDMVMFLDGHGVIPPDQRTDLACLALDRKAPAVADYLLAGVPARCEPDATADRIEARSVSR